jgi:hypothetical protein
MQPRRDVDEVNQGREGEDAGQLGDPDIFVDDGGETVPSILEYRGREQILARNRSSLRD